MAIMQRLGEEMCVLFSECQVNPAVTRWWGPHSGGYWLALTYGWPRASPGCCFAFFIIRSTRACRAFLIEVFYTHGWNHHSICNQWSFPKGQQLSLLPPPCGLLPTDAEAHSSGWQRRTPLSFVPSLLPYLCKPWQPPRALGTSCTKAPRSDGWLLHSLRQWRWMPSMNY